MVHNCDESPFRPSVGVIISNNILENDILKRSDRLCTVYVLGFQFITARRYAYRSMSVTHECRFFRPSCGEGMTGLSSMTVRKAALTFYLLVLLTPLD